MIDGNINYQYQCQWVDCLQPQHGCYWIIVPFVVDYLDKSQAKSQSSQVIESVVESSEFNVFINDVNSTD